MIKKKEIWSEYQVAEKKIETSFFFTYISL